MRARTGELLSKLSDQDLIDELRYLHSQSSDHSEEWRDEAVSLYDLISGHQWDEESKAQMRAQLKPIVTFNVAGKYIDVIGGLQINNRQEIRYLPREIGDAGVNELLTGTADWARDNCDAEDEESDAFVDCVTTGMGWIENFIERDSNPEGDFALQRRDPLYMFWDPNARRRNLRDARWVERLKRMSPAELEEKWPGSLDDLSNSDVHEGMDFLQGSPHLADEAWKYEHGNMDGSERERLYPVVAEFQWYEVDKMVDVQSKYGKKRLSLSQWRKLQKVLDQNGVQYETSTIRAKRYYRVFFSGTEVLERSDSPFQRGFTYQCITGKRDRNRNTWYGIGRSLKDPQMWMNKFFSQILDIINKNAKGGLMAEVGAFDDPQKAELDWSRPDKITFLEPGALSGNAPKIQQKPSIPYPQGLDRLMQFASSALPETSGLNLEILGLSGNVQAGVLEAQRKQSAMTIIAWAFDSMRRYYKDHGELLAYYIREYLSDGRLIRVNGQKGQKYIPLLREQLTFDYDVIVDESPTSPNMKERVWVAIQEIIPWLLKAGVPIPPEVIRYSPIPEDLQNEWIKMITSQMQQGSQPDPMQQAEIEHKKAQTNKTEADTVLSLQKARETAASTGQKMAGN